MGRHLCVVVVPSTFCNLRCSYCYELPLLKDKTRIGGDDLAIMFEHLALFCRENDVDVLRVVWHGGEPLLLPPDYYWKAFELARNAFAGQSTQIFHVTQTNLTVLDEERIALIRDGFHGTGVSLDIFGSLRVNAAGECKEHVAIKNLDLLLERNIDVAGITVLTKGNRRRVRRIYDFYAERSMSFRLLPLHQGDFGSNQWFEIGPQDTLHAFKTLADLFLDNPRGPQIHPIMSVVRDVMVSLEGEDIGRVDKRTFEGLLIIDKDGGVYPYSDFPSETACYGNVFRQPLSALLSSPAHERVMVETEARVTRTCSACPNLGKSCTGEPAAEFTQDFWEKNPDGTPRCTVFKGLIEHIRARLQASGVGVLSEAPLERIAV
ncbi:MAG: radical SAM protein [Labilithrix sp.]|nr:radical SAM protein [Labilithrix sp.]MCW5810486.1 radical SAM protein [Labilithrix sp.]